MRSRSLLFVPLATALVIHSASALTVVVVDLDTGNGIIADVIETVPGPPAVERPMATTDDRGVADNISCDAGDSIFVSPDQGSYPQASARPCGGTSKLTFKLRDLSRVPMLRRVAHAYELGGNSGRAAQAFSELNATVPSSRAELSVLTNVARALDVPLGDALVEDRQQGKVVASPKLVAKIEDFQSAHNLPADGILGAQTLAALANGPPSQNVLYPSGKH